jgi:hypothetical protein
MLAAFVTAHCGLVQRLDDLKDNADTDGVSPSAGSAGVLATGGADAGQGGSAGEACGFGQTSCRGRCTDLSGDPAHCGACDHDCLGGACVAGRCQPLEVASSGSPWEIVADATHVYWTDWFGSVRRTPLAGGPVELISNIVRPLAIVQDAKAIYWSVQESTEGIMTFAKAGGNPTVLALLPRAGSILILGSTLYFTQGSDWAAWNGSVSSLPVTGGSPTELATGLSAPGSLVTDGERLYWSSYWTGEIMSLPVDGTGLPAVHTKGDSQPAGLAVDATTIYWCTPSTGVIMSIAKNGKDPELVLDGQMGARSLRLHDGTLFWANDAGEILSMPVDGTAPETHATEQAVWSLFVNDEAIYWANRDPGRVMRLAR